MKKIKVFVWRVALVLLAVVFISTHMAAGLSAKYATKIDASGSFSTAKFAGGSVTVGQSSTVYVSEATKDGTHVFAAECTVDFGACEVSRQFSLTLSTQDNGISFSCPVGALYTVNNCNGSRDFNASDTIYGSALSVGKAYVGIGKIEENNTYTYTWSVADLSGDVKSIVAVSDKAIGMDASSYKVAVIYFRQLSTSTSASKLSGADIAFSLNCEQID